MPISEKTVEHKDFGKISVIRSPRASRISISMKPFTPIRLTMPVFVPYRRAEDFLRQKESWILKNIEKIRKLEGQYTIFTEGNSFQTADHQLEISRISSDQASVSLRGNKILVGIPTGADITDTGVQELIRTGIVAAWRKEAKKYLPARLEELSARHGLPFNRVFIKNNRSRWGSCSDKNNINLSLHLMRLPAHLIDYILTHELVHTIHRNHSRYFWNDLEKYYPGARKADREMREYRIDIF